MRIKGIVIIFMVFLLASCANSTFFTAEQLNYYGILDIEKPKGNTNRISIAMDITAVTFNATYHEFMDYAEAVYLYLDYKYSDSLSYPTTLKNELENKDYILSKSIDFYSHCILTDDIESYYFFYAINDKTINRYIIFYYYKDENSNRSYNAKMELHEY